MILSFAVEASGYFFILQYNEKMVFIININGLPVRASTN